MPVIIQHLLQRSGESGQMFLTGRNSIHEAAVGVCVRLLRRSVKIKLFYKSWSVFAFWSSGMWHCVFRLEVSDVSKELSTSIFKGQVGKKLIFEDEYHVNVSYVGKNRGGEQKAEGKVWCWEGEGKGRAERSGVEITEWWGPPLLID